MKKFRRPIYDHEHVLLRDWLIKKRKAAKLTQRELAKKIGVIHSLIGKVEKGERRLDVIEFITFCDGINAKPCELIELIQREKKEFRKGKRVKPDFF